MRPAKSSNFSKVEVECKSPATSLISVQYDAAAHTTNIAVEFVAQVSIFKNE
jgi:hypothetical protein